MGQGDFVLKMGQNEAKNVTFGVFGVSYSMCSKNTTNRWSQGPAF